MLARLLQACVWNIFHCGAQGNAKVYARRISCSLAIWWVLKTLNRWGSTPSRTCQVHLSRVRIPPYAFSSISPVVWWLPETAQMTVCESTRERYSTTAIARPRNGTFLFISNALLALFGNGYRVSNIWAKRFLSAYMCDHLKFWPQDAHEWLQTQLNL